MAKYIIELEGEPMVANSSHQEVDELWKAKGFNSLVFDQNGIKKLTPYTEPDRKAIENEVWEFARRIICPSDCCEDSISKYTEKFLGIPSHKTRAIFKDLSYQEARAKYEEWKKQKDDIHVGDEVTFEMAFGNGLDNNMKAVALDQATKGEEWCVLTENGCVETHDEEDLYKTGRHFDEIEELLKMMRDAE